jgi:hypothetical protein
VTRARMSVVALFQVEKAEELINLVQFIPPYNGIVKLVVHYSHGKNLRNMKLNEKNKL